MTTHGQNPLDQRPTMHPSGDYGTLPLRDDQDIYGPEAVGAYLRDVRLRRGIDPREVSNHIRIRPSQVEALEEGRVEDLPGVVYCIGYVRAYANLLGLDGEEAVRRFKEAGPVTPSTDLGFPEKTKSESRLPKPALVFGALVVAGAAYGGWLYYDSQPQGPRVAAVPEHLESKLPSSQADTSAAVESPSNALADMAAPQVDVVSDLASAPSSDTLPDSTEQPTLSPTQEVLAQAQSTADGVLDTPDEAAETGLPAVTVATEVPQPSLESAEQNTPATPGFDDAVRTQIAAVTPEDEAVTSAVGTSQATNSQAAAPEESAPVEATTAASQPLIPEADGQQLGQQSDSRITIRAEADSYVQVKDDKNTLYLQRVLRAGDVYHVPDQPGLEMVVSNAGGLLLLLDGTALPPLGADKQIMQGIELTPGGLRLTASN